MSRAVDFVTGRLVLMYLSDPAAVLRRAAELVRPGGMMCMHEADLDYLTASPMTPLWTQVHGYFTQALEKAGFAVRMGPALFTAFRAAGLSRRGCWSRPSPRADRTHRPGPGPT